MISLIKNYIEKRVDLVRLELTEKSVKIASGTIYMVLIILLLFFFLIFLTLGMGLLIGIWMNNYAYGILIISGVCLLKVLFFILFRKPITRMFANVILKNL